MKVKEISSKKWTIITLITVTFLLLFFAAIMFVTDPLLYFRKESGILSYWTYNQLYSGPGVARQYDYDTIVTGSCMVQQFDTHMIDELYGSKSVKLTYNGATAKNVKTILDICYDTHPDIKRIIIPMDTFMSIYDKDKYSYQIPEYMYSVSLENSVKYLLNLNIFYHQLLPGVFGTIQGKEHLAMEAEPENREYGAKLVVDSYTPSNRVRYSKSKTDNYLINTEENIRENILPIIEAHPETEFIFFVPPYSMLYWDKRCATAEAEPMLESLRMMMQACIPYENVKIYSYLWDEEITTNLDNYRDILHFSPEVQAVVLDYIYHNDGEVTIENYNQLIDSFIDTINNYDYTNLYDRYNEMN